jgi:hypothetical protein
MLDLDTMTLNILNFYAEATPSERREGFAWYPTAREAAANIATRNGITLEQAVATVAALSPQMEWNANLRWAAEAAEAHTAGLPLPLRGLGNSLRRAERALSGDLSDIMRTKGTLKVRNFYGSILGERGAVCVDRHAIRVALGDAHCTPPSLTDNRYLLVAEAYREAARDLRKSASGVQAVTWMVCKRLRGE